MGTSDCFVSAFLLTATKLPVVRIILKSVPNKLRDRKSTRLNSSHQIISYAVFCLKKKKRIVVDSHQKHDPFSATASTRRYNSSQVWAVLGLVILRLAVGDRNFESSTSK